jgi:hypothetical protein
VAGTCEYGNELPGSINAGNFLISCKTGTHYAGSWVGPRADLKESGEEKIPGSEPRIVQLNRLRSPGPGTNCVAYTTHRHVRKADRFQRTSDYPSTHSRVFAFPRDMTHTVVARFATEKFVRFCCPQRFARFSDFEIPIRTRI